MKKGELYKASLKRQKQGGWGMIIIGGIFTLTIVMSWLGIPMLIYGIWSVSTNKVHPHVARRTKKLLETQEDLRK